MSIISEIFREACNSFWQGMGGSVFVAYEITGIIVGAMIPWFMEQKSIRRSLFGGCVGAIIPATIVFGFCFVKAPISLLIKAKQTINTYEDLQVFSSKTLPLYFNNKYPVAKGDGSVNPIGVDIRNRSGFPIKMIFQNNTFQRTLKSFQIEFCIYHCKISCEDRYFRQVSCDNDRSCLIYSSPSTRFIYAGTHPYLSPFPINVTCKDVDSVDGHVSLVGDDMREIEYPFTLINRELVQNKKF